MENQKHVIIIGAGLAGLTTAREILNSHKSYKVTLLEAQDRVGGRTKSIQISDTWFDMGGTWIGPQQKHALKLAKEAKNPLILQYNKGKKIMELFNQVSSYSSEIPDGVNLLSLAHLQILINLLNKWAKEVPCEKPYNAPKAVEWDSITLQQYVDQNVIDVKIKKLVEVACRGVLGVEPCEVSFLHFLWYIHQSETFENLVEIDNANQQYKLAHGSSRLSTFMLSEMEKNSNFEIRLSTFVDKIIHSFEKIIIDLRNGEKLSCDFLVTAMPPCSLGRIEFQPLLPQNKRFMIQRNFMGAITKILLVYKNAFWRENGFTGEGIGDCLGNPCFNIFDECRPRKVLPNEIKITNQEVFYLFYYNSKIYLLIKNLCIQK